MRGPAQGDRPPASGVVIAALVAAALTYAVTQTLLVPALPGFQRELHTSAVGATALVSVFFISGAITTGVVGRLGDMLGKRRMLLFELVLFALGAVVCALADSLPALLVGRVVMGTGLAIFPLSFSIIRDTLPAERVTYGVVIIAATGGTGAALGQGLGGVVVDQLGYHWVFWIGAIMAAASLGAVALLVPESPIRTPGRVDVIGAVLLAGAVGTPLVAVSQTPEWGWGGVPTLSLIALGLVLGAVFVAYERRQPEPLLHLETLTYRPVAMTNLATLLVGFSMFGAAVIFTQFFQEPTRTGYGFGASATQAGLFLVPGYLMILLVSPLAGRISTRAGPKITLVSGCAVACLALTLMTLAHHHRVEMYLWPALLYAGTGFAFGAMPTLILQSVPPELTGQSTAFNLVLRNIGTSFGTQISATFIVASIGASRFPAEHGYTRAFGLGAVVAGLATLVGLVIPGSGRRSASESVAAPAAEGLAAEVYPLGEAPAGSSAG
jgi:MFS family permease